MKNHKIKKKPIKKTYKLNKKNQEKYKTNQYLKIKKSQKEKNPYNQNKKT
jgi:hypothetical protein